MMPNILFKKLETNIPYAHWCRSPQNKQKTPGNQIQYHIETQTWEYYAAIKKEILPIITAWVDKWSQTEKDKYYMISLICGILKIKLTEKDSDL